MQLVLCHKDVIKIMGKNSILVLYFHTIYSIFLKFLFLPWPSLLHGTNLYMSHKTYQCVYKMSKIVLNLFFLPKWDNLMFLNKYTPCNRGWIRKFNNTMLGQHFAMKCISQVIQSSYHPTLYSKFIFLHKAAHILK